MGNMQVGNVNFTGIEQNTSSKRGGKAGKLIAGTLIAASVITTAIAAKKGDVFKAVKEAESGNKLKTFFSNETFNGETLGKLGKGFAKVGKSIMDIGASIVNGIRGLFKKGGEEATHVAEEIADDVSGTV